MYDAGPNVTKSGLNVDICNKKYLVSWGKTQEPCKCAQSFKAPRGDREPERDRDCEASCCKTHSLVWQLIVQYMRVFFLIMSRKDFPFSDNMFHFPRNCRPPPADVMILEDFLN